jgi:hypothetical protein
MRIFAYFLYKIISMIFWALIGRQIAMIAERINWKMTGWNLQRKKRKRVKFGFV